MILRGWKEIAAHLGSAVRTVQRWEQHGLPIRRPTIGPRSRVIADAEELDSWRRKAAFWRTERFDLLGNVERNEDLRRRLHKELDTLRTRVAAIQRELAAITARRKRLVACPQTLTAEALDQDHLTQLI